MGASFLFENFKENNFRKTSVFSAKNLITGCLVE